jgi:phospholipid transport system transporter-binding protein
VTSVSLDGSQLSPLDASPALSFRICALRSPIVEADEPGALVDIDQFEHDHMEIQPEPQQLRLPADCSIGGIRVVYDLICKALADQQKLELDCSGVDKADVTSVQLLLSTAKTARHFGNRVSLTAVSDVLRSAIKRAGVSSRAMPDSHPAQPAEIK